MKKLLSLSLLILFSGLQLANAQKPQESTEKTYTYTEVVQVPGASKDLLFDRAMRVLPTMYKEVEKKIQEKDKESGKILIATKTRTSLKDKSGVMRPDIYINYKFSLNFKEGKYKYEFYDIHIDEGGVKTPIKKYMEDAGPRSRADEKYAYFEEDVKKLIGQLKEGMKADKVQIKEDW